MGFIWMWVNYNISYWAIKGFLGLYRFLRVIIYGCIWIHMDLHGFMWVSNGFRWLGFGYMVLCGFELIVTKVVIRF